MSSNITIKFESEKVAHGRSTLHATHGISEKDLTPNFYVGGYYYYSFRKRKHGEPWKITFLFLDVNWTEGDSLGLNEDKALRNVSASDNFLRHTDLPAYSELD